MLCEEGLSPALPYSLLELKKEMGPLSIEWGREVEVRSGICLSEYRCAAEGGGAGQNDGRGDISRRRTWR